MRAIINGVVYDTGLSRRIGDARERYAPSDSRWRKEALFRSIRPCEKRFFIAGYGGPSSPYGRVVGDNVLPGGRIKPLSDRQAADWAQDNLPERMVDRMWEGLPVI